jgi:hypothetical protein
MDLVEIDDPLAHLAGEKAEDPDVVLIASDRPLVAAANSEGLAVAQLP